MKHTDPEHTVTSIRRIDPLVGKGKKRTGCCTSEETYRQSEKEQPTNTTESERERCKVRLQQFPERRMTRPKIDGNNFDYALPTTELADRGLVLLLPATGSSASPVVASACLARHQRHSFHLRSLQTKPREVERRGEGRARGVEASVERSGEGRARASKNLSKWMSKSRRNTHALQDRNRKGVRPASCGSGQDVCFSSSCLETSHTQKGALKEL